MPRATPSRHGSPRRIPTPAPVAVSSRLLGPGVPAAATAKRRNATTCSGVMMEPMADRLRGTRALRLERSCGRRPSDWLCSRELSDGVQTLQAWFSGRGFETHRHDTYAIGLTDVGVQAFDYRGMAETSTPGQVVVLHPDETHDGRAGTPDGFGYRIVYVAPARIHEAARAIRGRFCPLPFVREAVATNQAVAAAIEAAFRLDPVPLAIDSLVVGLTEALLDADPSCRQEPTAAPLDERALARARAFLDAETDRVIRSSELEAITVLTRYDLPRPLPPPPPPPPTPRAHPAPPPSVASTAPARSYTTTSPHPTSPSPPASPTRPTSPASSSQPSALPPPTTKPSPTPGTEPYERTNNTALAQLDQPCEIRNARPASLARGICEGPLPL